jgi:hypothetical protein
MSRYSIIPCTLGHLRELARTMRAKDRAEIESVGLKPRHLLFARYRKSWDSKTALVDGEVAACWGDNAPMLSEEGHLWLFTAPPVERVPLAYLREVRRDVARRLENRSVLRTYTTDSYKQAIRFFAMAGFVPGPPITLNGGGSVLYREMRLVRASLGD